jgi:hypothetical protein
MSIKNTGRKVDSFFKLYWFIFFAAVRCGMWNECTGQGRIDHVSRLSPANPLKKEKQKVFCLSFVVQCYSIHWNDAVYLIGSAMFQCMEYHWTTKIRQKAFYFYFFKVLTGLTRLTWMFGHWTDTRISYTKLNRFLTECRTVKKGIRGCMYVSVGFIYYIYRFIVTDKNILLQS